MSPLSECGLPEFTRLSKYQRLASPIFLGVIVFPLLLRATQQLKMVYSNYVKQRILFYRHLGKSHIHISVNIPRRFAPRSVQGMYGCSTDAGVRIYSTGVRIYSMGVVRIQAYKPAATDNIHVHTYGRSTQTFFCHVLYGRVIHVVELNRAILVVEVKSDRTFWPCKSSSAVVFHGR